jgi:hypothetical protein
MRVKDAISRIEELPLRDKVAPAGRFAVLWRRGAVSWKSSRYLVAGSTNAQRSETLDEAKNSDCVMDPREGES